MGYFPFFIDIKDKKCLVVGGGTVAQRKVEKLVPFEPKIVVVAPDINDAIRSFSGITIIEREFESGDLDGTFMVIAATDNERLNAEIYERCVAENILVNVVDDKEKCGFIFPALVKKGDVSIGISSSGKSPVFSRRMKERIDEMLDNDSLHIQHLLSESRQRILNELPTEEKRKQALEYILSEAEKGKEPDVDEVIRKVKSE